MRVACLSCIDGRIHDAVFKGILKIYADAIVDLITEPGPDGFFFKDDHIRASILDKIDLSLSVNHSKALVCVGHYDCKGHSVSIQDHRNSIQKLVLFLKHKYPELPCHGLWINERWFAEELEI